MLKKSDKTNLQEQLNVLEPNKEIIWNGIQNKRWQKQRKQKRTWQAVAINTVAASIVFTLMLFQHKPESDRGYTLADFGRENEIVEKNYLHQIKKIEKQIELESETDWEIGNELKREIEILDSIFWESKPELDKTAREDLIVESLYNYYERKLKILSMLEKEIERQKRLYEIIEL